MIKSLTKTIKVTSELLACNIGSGSLEVLATPAIIALLEGLSAQLAQEYISDDMTTVGTLVTLQHSSPTLLNAEITLISTLEQEDGKKFTFTIEAQDNKGIIAEGSHRRVAVQKDNFIKKAQSKLGD